ncbi:MAG: hypothetical protein JSW34_11660 [Candidatus Zixiibacteriota bacterium]|nr:MAG: hypothetical protein JSW34_11660 [candidate division Zixibacteria bacterium]
METPNEVKHIDIRELLAIALRRKWLVVLPVVIITAVAYGSTYFLQPKYEASTIVWIDKPASVSRELMSIVGDRRETREEQMSRQLALQTEITSKNFLLQLIREMKLDDDAEITSRAVKARESTPEYSLEEIKYNLLVEKLRGQISVSFHGYDQIRIRVESHDPFMARSMADRLATILEREKAKYEMEKILDNQAFTDTQLKKTEYYYQRVLDSLNAAQARLSRLQLPEAVASEANHAAISSSIEKTRLERDDYRRELAALQSQLQGYNLAEARLKYSDSIVTLRTAIDGLVATYGNMMEKYAWNEQNVIDVNIRLNANMRFLEEAVQSAVGAQYGALPANQQQLLTRYFIVKENLDILNSKETRLQQPLDEINRRILLVPQLESEIVELQSRVENARRYRDAFRSEETTAGILSEQARDRVKYRVVEPAQLPLEAFWPDKRKIILLGFVLGLALGAAFVFLTELFDHSFRRVEDVEATLGLPVLATIPRVENLKVMK